jgi:RNA polymerase primary sigma factor
MNHVAKFRIDKIAELARQLSFTPQDARHTQLGAAEDLLLDLQPEKAYPFNFVLFRITGYHPRSLDPTLLTGLALQHDLGLLIEQVSQTLNLQAALAAQPVLSIDEVSQRFNVTSKSIQRWRRRGLAARRFLFPDGKRRVGFLLGSVEKFLALHSGQMLAAANFSQLGEEEKTQILRRALRMVAQGRCGLDEISRRIGRKLNRSPLAVTHVLRNRIPATSEIGPEDRVEILRAYRRGTTLTALARQLGRSRSTIYRVILDERLARLSRRKIRFIDDPLYHQPGAAQVIEQIVSQQELPPPRTGEESRIPRDLPAYLRELYRTPLLPPGRERALFLKLNFHKYEFVSARRRIDPQFARARDLAELESARRRTAAAKNEIVRANLRLVVSVARRHLRPGICLMDLISDGNLILMRAVDSFDAHRGNRFSTYATFALMKGFARGVPQMLASARRAMGGEAMLSSLPDPRNARLGEHMMDREEVRQLLSRLGPRERDVIAAHYGLGEGRPATYQQVGSRMGLSKQRVRQIEQIALAKLRAAPG